MPWPGLKKQTKAGPVNLASQDPTAAAKPPRPKSLWESAFSRLSDEKPDLVRRFIVILESEAHAVTLSPKTGPQGPPAQVCLSDLIERKLAAMKDRQWRVSLGKKSIELREQIDRVLQIVIMAKDLGSSLASMDPIHAGIPWAGVCVLLPLLLNDSQQRTIVTNGLESIAKLIRRFSEVENFYLRKTQHRLCEDLEEALSTLYFHILEFEARSVCQFDRNTASQTGRNIIKADGWQDILNAIEKSETTCNILARIIDTETQHKWNDQIEALISEQTSKVDKILKLSEQSSVQVRAQFARKNIFKDDSTIFDLDSNEAKCLALFRTTDYEFDKNKNPTRLEGTCEWFLKHPIYQKWHQNNSVGWLWVTANPGCGKSVLARSLVDEFCETVKEPRTCYFFFKDNTEKNRSVNHALCAILHQLIYRDRALLRYAMDAYHSNGKQLPDLIEPLWKILLSILEALQEPVICILDALDECSESSRIVLIQKLAALFSNEPNSPKLKVLMTSRPNTVVENAIWDHGINPVSIQLTGEREVESLAISEEIDVYIAAKIRHFKELREYRGINDEAHETLHEKLRGIENRTYLWVSLIFPELELHAGVSEAKLLGLIKQVPTTVQEAYEKILNRSLDARRARLLLHIVVAAYQPLTLTEMNIALAVQDHSDPMEDLDTEPTASFEVTVRELCGLFIMVKDAKIYLIHQTAKEFLAQVDEQEHAALADLSPWNWRYSFNPADSHRIVARTCMLYLYLSYLRRKKTEEEMTVGQFQHMKTAWDSFSKYTKKSWMKHFSEAGFSGTTGIESSIAGICATPSIKKTLTWAQLYKSASSWSSSPESYVVKVNFNALNMASFHGHADMVNRFLKTYTATEKGIPSIRWALQNNHTTVAHALLDTIPSDSSNGHILNAAFHIACSAGEETIVSRLLTYSTVNPCHPDSLGRTALFWAARAGRKVVVQQLIKVREQHHWPKDDVGSLLLIAAFHGFEDVVHLLKSYGPAESSKFRIAALYQAISRDHACVMQALLEDHGSIAISRSELERLIIVALTYNKQASIDVLLQYSFNVNARDAHGQTTLFLAADKTIKDKLINMGADVNAIASLGWNQCYEGVGETLLYRAVASGDYEFAQLLLRHGADVNVRCRDGQTAIFTAVAAANFELVLLLLDAGANPTIKNQYGLSPVQMVGDVSCSTLKRMKTSEHQMELLALMDHAAHKHGEQIEGTNDAMRLRNLVPNPQSYHELLQEDSESIDWETFAQILEMDEPDDDNDHHFSRELVSNFFQQYQGSIIAEAKDLLASGDFEGIYGTLGDFMRSNCATVGFQKASQICDIFLQESHRFNFWVGCRHDGEDESADAECLRRLKQAANDLQEELTNMEQRMQDFYYEIQDPRFDPDTRTLAQQKLELLNDVSAKTDQATTIRQEMDGTSLHRRSSI